MIVTSTVVPAKVEIYNLAVTAQLTEEQLAMWRAFLEAHSAVIRYLEQGMQEEHGLPLTWFDVLVHLADAPEGRLRLGELADSVILTRSGITRLVDRMAAAGLVRREPCPGDRRGHYAVITAEGEETIQRVAPGHSQRAWDAFVKHVDADEMPVLEAVFSRVLRHGGQQPNEDSKESSRD